MQPNRDTLLCHYRYDPLDRLTVCKPSNEASIQRFYLKDRLTTEIQAAVQRSIMQVENQLLAQQERRSETVETRLLAIDQQRSVLNVIDATRVHRLAYTPYGHRPPENGLLSLLGFNGERPDPVTGCYLLGNGYRAFNPVLMRFNSPDSWSPFGRGGLNAYAYCVGDPINRVDPTGHSWAFIKGVMRSRGLIKSNMQGSENRFLAIGSGNVQSSSTGRFRNTLANARNPYPDKKSPAWTTQETVHFAGTEARHPGAPSPASSQESLDSYASDSSGASLANIQPLSAQRPASAGTPPRQRSGAVLSDDVMDEVIAGLRARHGDGNPPTIQPDLVSDLPPSYSQSSLAAAPPSYQQAMLNIRYLEATSRQQSLIRR